MRTSKASLIVQNEKIYILGGIQYEDNYSRNIQRLGSIKIFNTQTKSLEKTTARLPFHIEDAIMTILPLPARREEEEEDPNNPDDHNGSHYSPYGSHDDDDAASHYSNRSDRSNVDYYDDLNSSYRGSRSNSYYSGGSPAYNSANSPPYNPPDSPRSDYTY